MAVGTPPPSSPGPGRARTTSRSAAPSARPPRGPSQRCARKAPERPSGAGHVRDVIVQVTAAPGHRCPESGTWNERCGDTAITGNTLAERSRKHEHGRYPTWEFMNTMQGGLFTGAGE